MSFNLNLINWMSENEQQFGKAAIFVIYEYLNFSEEASAQRYRMENRKENIQYLVDYATFN